MSTQRPNHSYLQRRTFSIQHREIPKVAWNIEAQGTSMYRAGNNGWYVVGRMLLLPEEVSKSWKKFTKPRTNHYFRLCIQSLSVKIRQLPEPYRRTERRNT